MEQRITSRKNPALQQIRKWLASRRERDEARRFVADGVKLLWEAMAHGAALETVLLSEGMDVDLPDEVQILRVPEDVMASVSPMHTPQGVLFVCRMPDPVPFVPKPGMLLLDGLQDPGNLGTILRTADAWDVPVALLEGCADAYNPKTIRASMGALFRTPIVETTWQEAKAQCASADIPVVVTALTQQAKDLRQVPLRDSAVVIGSEGHGIRPEILDAASLACTIPMHPRCESLNAAIAAAIVMWQMIQ